MTTSNMLADATGDHINTLLVSIFGFIYYLRIKVTKMIIFSNIVNLLVYSAHNFLYLGVIYLVDSEQTIILIIPCCNRRATRWRAPRSRSSSWRSNSRTSRTNMTGETLIYTTNSYMHILIGRSVCMYL